MPAPRTIATATAITLLRPTASVDLGADGHNTYLSIEFRRQDALPLDHRPRYSTSTSRRSLAPTHPPRSALSKRVQPIRSPTPLTAWCCPTPRETDPAALAAASTRRRVASFLTPCATGGTVTTGCEYDQGGYLQIEPETTNYNALLRHTMKLGDGWQRSSRPPCSGSKAEQVDSPSYTLNAWPSLTGGFDAEDPARSGSCLPIGNPNNPYPANPAWLAYSFGDVGCAADRGWTRPMYRFVSDLDGVVAGWSVNASIGAIRGLSYLTYEGYVSLSALMPSSPTTPT